MAEEKISLNNIVKSHQSTYSYSVVILVFLSILYLLFSTEYYESHLSLYPSQNDPTMGTIFEELSGFANQLGLTNPGTIQNKFDVNDIVQSRTLLNSIVNKECVTYEGIQTDLISFWGFDKEGMLSSIYSGNNSIITQSIIHENALQELSERIRIEEELTGLRKIYLKMEDAALSANIVNYMGDFIQDFIKNELVYEAKNNRLFIEERIQKSQSELARTEDGLTSFQRKHSLAIDDPDIALSRIRLTRAVEISQEKYIILSQQLELAKIEELRHRPIVNILDKGDIMPEPKYPRKLLVLGTAILFGLILGTMISFYQEEKIKY